MIDEQHLQDVLRDLADDVAIDETTARPVATRALRRHTRRRVLRREGTVAFLSILLIVGIVVAVGDHTTGDVRTVASTTATRRLPHRLVVRQSFGGDWAPEPIAFDGRDVWLANNSPAILSRGSGSTNATPSIAIERHASDSGRLLDVVRVPQEAVFSIAAGSGSVWVVGGGDGGVPRTTVSRVDLATRRVVLTRALAARDSCACSLAVGAGSAWLAGQGSTNLYRIDESGAVAARIRLPHPSVSLAVVGDNVEVGLDDSRVAVIDTATNRTTRVVPIATPGAPAASAIVGITAAAQPGASWVTRSDGLVFEIVDGRRVSPKPVVFLRPASVSGATLERNVLWAVGVDQIVASTTDGTTRGYANYDAGGGSFGPVSVRSRRFVPSPSNEPGLDRVVVAGPTLWIAVFNGTILVVAPS
ncbi:MAG TPA: hypothetical protein VH914_02750 [Acidimicrobiia bacterium]|nr:hypothetical protein [Acidimicrobiia bacterium]